MRSAANPWILAARPKTLWAAVAPVMMGSVMAYRAGGFHLLSCVAALAGAVLIQIGTNFANDYFDYQKGADGTDRLGPVRVTQSGLISPLTMRQATVVVFGLAILVGVYLVWRAGWPIVAIGLTSVLFGVLYTAGPVPLGYVGLGDLFVLIYFGPVAVGGTYYVQTLSIDGTILTAGLAPGLFSVAILTVNNLRDIKEDRLAGKKTLAARFGPTFARGEYLAAVVVASLLPVCLWLAGGSSAYASATVVVPLVAVPVIKKVLTTSDGAILNDALASTGKLLMLYSLIFTVGWLL